jgi:hypothetical protein
MGRPGEVRPLDVGITVISFMRGKRTAPGEIVTGLWVGQQRVLDAPRGLLDAGPNGALYFTSVSAEMLLQLRPRQRPLSVNPPTRLSTNL